MKCPGHNSLRVKRGKKNGRMERKKSRAVYRQTDKDDFGGLSGDEAKKSI